VLLEMVTASYRWCRGVVAPTAVPDRPARSNGILPRRGGSPGPP